MALASDPDSVHFPTDVELVAAMISHTATGNQDADWIWEQAGLPVSLLRSPADRIVAALRLHPDVAVVALSRAASDCGIAALDRALGDSGWLAVAGALGTPQPVVVERPARGVMPLPETSAAAYGTTVAFLEASPFGRLVLHSRLRPSRPVTAFWAWLVVAEVEPALLPSPDEWVAAVQAVIVDRLSPEPPTAGEVGDGVVLDRYARQGTPSPPDDGRDGDEGQRPVGWPSPASDGDGHEAAGAPTPATADEPPSRPHHDGRSFPDTTEGRDSPRGAGTEDRAGIPSASRSTQVPERHARDPLERVSTGWAGLVHLLATAEAAGLPSSVTDDPVLAGRGVRWTVWRAALALTQARTDDPAVLALCGLDSGRADVVVRSLPATPAEVDRVTRLARRWRGVTLRRLRSAPSGRDTMPADRRLHWDWLVRREGEVVASMGWIDVILPLRSVDTAVRSAGLDLDPGFVPWLGTVVEIRYE
jgi:hypothetical protein